MLIRLFGAILQKCSLLGDFYSIIFSAGSAVATCIIWMKLDSKWIPQCNEKKDQLQNEQFFCK